MISAIKGMVGYFIASILGIVIGYLTALFINTYPIVGMITIVVIITLVGGLVNYNKEK